MAPTRVRARGEAWRGGGKIAKQLVRGVRVVDMDGRSGEAENRALRG